MYCTLYSLCTVSVCIVHCTYCVQYLYVLYIVLIVYSICMYCTLYSLRPFHLVTFSNLGHVTASVHMMRMYPLGSILRLVKDWGYDAILPSAYRFMWSFGKWLRFLYRQIYYYHCILDFFLFVWLTFSQMSRFPYTLSGFCFSLLCLSIHMSACLALTVDLCTANRTTAMTTRFSSSSICSLFS